MDWDDEIYQLIGLKSAYNKKRAAAAAPAETPQSPDTTEHLLDTALKTTENVGPFNEAIQPPKSGVWSDSKLFRSDTGNIMEHERFHESTIVTDNANNEEDQIPVIPDLDELHEDYGNSPEKITPTVLVNPSTYEELDQDLSENQPTPSGDIDSFPADNVNLTLLSKQLCPEKDVQEGDEEWTMESLFNDFITVATP